MKQNTTVIINKIWKILEFPLLTPLISINIKINMDNLYICVCICIGYDLKVTVRILLIQIYCIFLIQLQRSLSFVRPWFKAK